MKAIISELLLLGTLLTAFALNSMAFKTAPVCRLSQGRCVSIAPQICAVCALSGGGCYCSQP